MIWAASIKRSEQTVNWDENFFDARLSAEEVTERKSKEKTW